MPHIGNEVKKKIFRKCVHKQLDLHKFCICCLSCLSNQASDAIRFTLPGDIQKTEPNLLEVKNKQQHKRIVKLEMDFI